MLRYNREPSAVRDIVWPWRSIDDDLTLTLALPRTRLKAPSVTEVVVWSTTLATSTLPNIILREVLGVKTDWLITAKLLLLAALVILTLIWRKARPLLGYFLVLFMFYGTGRVLRMVYHTPVWNAWFQGNQLFVHSMLGSQILRFGTAAVVIGTLRLLGHRPKDMYLGCGKLCAPAAPVRWLNIQRGATWNRLGVTFSLVASLGTSSFLVAAGKPALGNFGGILPVLPFILLFAAMNAFSEEATFRSALLTTLPKSLGKQSKLLLTASYFGLAHYWGVPYGTIGVLLAGLLGWLLGKIMLETEGFFWPWFIHFLQDVAIYTFMAVGLVTAGGG